MFWDSPTHSPVALDKQFELLGESTFSPFDYGFLRPLPHINCMVESLAHTNPLQERPVRFMAKGNLANPQPSLSKYQSHRPRALQRVGGGVQSLQPDPPVEPSFPAHPSKDQHLSIGQAPERPQEL